VGGAEVGKLAPGVESIRSAPGTADSSIPPGTRLTTIRVYSDSKVLISLCH